MRDLGYDETIYLHGALTKISDFYSKNNIKLGNISNISECSRSEYANKLVLCPPSSLNDKWSQKFKNVVKGYASGWMRIRQRVKQKNIELPLILSDHADWGEILKTVNDVNPNEVLVTHGREEALVHYLTKKNFKNSALNLIDSKTRMNDFAELLNDLILSPSRKKIDLLKNFFCKSNIKDKGWAFCILTNRMDRKFVSVKELKELIIENSDEDLFRFSYDYVGDLAETISLLWESNYEKNTKINLHEFMEIFQILITKISLRLNLNIF